MIIVRNAPDELLVREICANCSLRADDDTGVYMVFENEKIIGNCIYKLKDEEGMIIFADLNIVRDVDISELTLRTVTDYMMRHGAKKLVSYASFPETVYKSVGFTLTEKGAEVNLEGFSLTHCCGH